MKNYLHPTENERELRVFWISRVIFSAFFAAVAAAFSSL